MKRAITLAAVAAFALTGAACGSSQPAVSYADKYACRGVWRLQHIATINHGTSAGLAPFAASVTLTAGAVGTTQPPYRDMLALANRVVVSNAPTTAGLAQVERDCRKLGITARNAEDLKS